MARRGIYVAFEGGEGCGKSTQARLLADRIDGLVTREPGGTPLGSELRRLVLSPAEAPVSPRAETLLMAADRAQHLVEVVEPALVAGRHVVSDRSAFSSLAYQGGGRGLGVDAVRAINEWALCGQWPDAVILLDVDPAVATQRLDRSLDRLEQEAMDFHRRVRETFLELAAADPDRWTVVAGEASIETVASVVWGAVGSRFEP